MRIFKFILYFITTAFINTKIRKFNFQDIISKKCSKLEKRQLKVYTEKESSTIERKIINDLNIIDKAALYFPGNAKCLHKAILQYRLIRGRFKLPVKIVVGVKKFPFSSHAWLQWKNTKSNVCEADENIVGYSIIFDSDQDIAL